MRSDFSAILQKSEIRDYTIYTLFSEWDILVRVWASYAQLEALRQAIHSYSESHVDRPPEMVTVNVLHHFSSVPAPSEADVTASIERTSIARLVDIDEKRESSIFFNLALTSGWMLSDQVRFDDSKVQFSLP